MMKPTMEKNDLISRKVLLDSEESFMRLAECRSCDTPSNSPAYMRYVTQASERRNFVERLKTVPAVDAVPVVHGRWISSGFEVKFINCSVCGKQRFQIDATNYCPYCGARMDGKDDDNENR